MEGAGEYSLKAQLASQEISLKRSDRYGVQVAAVTPEHCRRETAVPLGELA
jgi:hypothetical protein